MPRKARDTNSTDNLKAFLERANRLLDERDALDSGIVAIRAEVEARMKELGELRDRLGMLGTWPLDGGRLRQAALAAE